jgi:hypothetical protein
MMTAATLMPLNRSTAWPVDHVLFGYFYSAICRFGDWLGTRNLKSAHNSKAP